MAATFKARARKADKSAETGHNKLPGTAETRGRLRKEVTATVSADPDEEISHLQADGFWGFEKGFHDAEERRR